MNSPDSINFYLKLQYRRIGRALKDNGIYPWLIIPISIALFIFLTIRLLDDFAFGEYIYLFIGLSLSFPLTRPQRLEFIKQISSNRKFYIIRIVEQVLMLLPFIIGLLVYRWYVMALVLFMCGVILCFGKMNYQLPFSIPTPFGRTPFEFPAGFRKTLPLIILSYALIPIGLNVGNFNLALASVAAMGFIVGGFHSSPEPRFYVWIFKSSPAQFINKKIYTILKYVAFLVIPITAVLLFYDISEYLKIILISIAAMGFAIMCMLSKYISYPQEINIVQGLAMGGSILFPPIMLAIIPWFYFKALQRLQTVLK